jgi:Leucine-rich repeat (LRR) protein
LKKFKLGANIIELYEDNSPYLFFKGQQMKDLSDLSRFKELKELIIIDCKMEKINTSISELRKLDVLSIPKNRVTELPACIGDCRSLYFINLKGNKIHSIPETIGELDKSRGGSLEYMAVNPSDIGEANFTKLKSLLPQTSFIS